MIYAHYLLAFLNTNRVYVATKRAATHGAGAGRRKEGEIERLENEK